MTKKELNKLKDILMVCKLNTASFSQDKDEDTKIKQRIRLWLETWIQFPIEEIVDKYDVIINKKIKL